MGKKVLVSGATGAMGQYLVPHLAELGYEITGLTIDDTVSTLPNVRYLKKDAYDADGMQTFLQQEKFDGIVDFMIYNTAQNPRLSCSQRTPPSFISSAGPYDFHPFPFGF